MFNYKTHGIIMFIICLLLSLKIAIAQEANDPRLSIYSKVRDRHCFPMSLDKCDCPDAKEMKAYIDALIETGVSKEEIFYKVARRFSISTILDNKIAADIEKRLVQEIGPKRPKIVLELACFDLGKVNIKQGKVRKKIKLYNKGNTDLIIKNVRVACSCSKVSLTVGRDKSPYFSNMGAEPGWQMVVRPKKAGVIEFIMDLTQFKEEHTKINRDIFITTNDPLNPEVGITISTELFK